MTERKENSSLFDSRLVKGGAVFAVIGAVLGVGIIVEASLLAVGGGAAAHYVTKKRENNK